MPERAKISQVTRVQLFWYHLPIDNISLRLHYNKVVYKINPLPAEQQTLKEIQPNENRLWRIEIYYATLL